MRPWRIGTFGTLRASIPDPRLRMNPFGFLVGSLGIATLIIVNTRGYLLEFKWATENNDIAALQLF